MQSRPSPARSNAPLSSPVFRPVAAASARRRRPAPRVLVIQENATVCELLGTVLERQGFAVTTATSYERGLLAALDEPLDLVIADYRAPGAAENYLQVLRCQEQAVAGEFELVPKPFTIDSLLAALARLLAEPEAGLVSRRWLEGSGSHPRVAEPTLSLPLPLAG